MKEIGLVSVIMPVHNGERFLTEAIQSVLRQTYTFIELIVINDGSTDGSKNIICAFNDPRIKYLEQENKGVSSARNKGLACMRGDFFCFLDADDIMPEKSIEDRLEIFFKDSNLAYVVGGQIQKDLYLEKDLCIQIPSFKGYPLKALARLDSSCFINCGTWLIKKIPGKVYNFNEDWTHCEDLAFFYSISQDGQIGFTQNIAQIYRRSGSSAMANIEGLDRGYVKYYRLIKDDKNVHKIGLLYLKFKIMKIMFLSYLNVKKYGKASKVLFQYILL